MKYGPQFFAGCVIGGLIGTFIAYLVNPSWCWLGTLAGFAAGYVIQDSMTFLRAIPRAIRASVPDMESGRSKNYLLATLPGILVMAILIQDAIHSGLPKNTPWYGALFVCTVLILGTIIISYLLLTITCVLGSVLADDIEDYADSYLRASQHDDDFVHGKDWVKHLALGLAGGYFLAVGFLIAWAFRIAFWYFWIYAARFLKFLVLYTITHERVLAGTCAAMGTFVATLLRPEHATAPQLAFLVSCGGALGGFFGFVSKRVLTARFRSPETA